MYVLRQKRAWLLAAILAALAALILALVHPATGSATVDRAAATSVGQRATVVLKSLKIKAAASMHGYSRGRFGPAWTDNNTAPLGHNHCDTRDDILRRDLANAAYKSGSRCTIATGTLRDPYTGKSIHFVRGVATSNAVQIDHVVALGDAWQTGARAWTATRRTALANDPLNLLAVDGPTNESKGDADAASWLPRRSYRCLYVATQIAVKARYHLWVTRGEHRAMIRVLRTCPGQRVPTEAARDRLRTVAVPKPAVSTPRTSAPAPTVGTTVTTPVPTSTAPTTTTVTTVVPPPVMTTSYTPPPPGTVYGVHPGAFCSPPGALGYTSAGTRMICGPGSDGRNRWHSY